MQCLKVRLVWMAAYTERTTHRYMLLYIREMEQLPETHSDVHQQLTAGAFVVYLTCNM